MMKSLVLATALLAMPALAMAASDHDQAAQGAGAHATGQQANRPGIGAESRSLPSHPYYSGEGAGPGNQHSLRHATGSDNGE